MIYDTSNIYLSGNNSWNISSNSNSTNLCFNYNSMNKTYIDTSGDIYLDGDIYRSGTSLTSTLNNYALLSNSIFRGSNLYFLSTSNGGWNISYSSSSFGISLNNVIMALSINNSGVVSIPAGISGYSTTSQVNTLISNALSSYSTTSATNTLITTSLTNYVTSSNLTSTLSNYVTNSNLTSTLSNYSINTMSVDYLACINNSNFTNAGTYPSYPYTCQMSGLYSSYCIDCTSITGPSEYLISLPTNFVNGRSIYICNVPILDRMELE